MLRSRSYCNAIYLRKFHCAHFMNAGHNKWSQIKHKKAANDLKRSALTVKYAAAISLAAKLGNSGDPALNIQLAAAVNQAKSAGVTKTVIENAIARGTNSSSGSKPENFSTTQYQILVPQNNVAMIVEAATDNVNRTVANIRSYAKDCDATVTDVSYRFEPMGIIRAKFPEHGDEEKAIQDCLDCDALDASFADKNTQADWDVIFHCETNKLNEVAKSLTDRNYYLLGTELGYIPKEQIELDKEIESKLNKLFRLLDDKIEVVKEEPTLPKGGSHKDAYNKMLNDLNDSCYIIYDFHSFPEAGRECEKVILISYCDDSAAVKTKMKHTAYLETVKSKLGYIPCIEANDKSDITYDAIDNILNNKRN